MKNKAAALAFEAWHGEIMEARRLLAIVDRVGKRMQNREACAALGSWHRIMHVRRRLFAMFGRRKEVTNLAALHGWSYAAHKRRYYDLRSQQISERHEKLEVLRSLKLWLGRAREGALWRNLDRRGLTYRRRHLIGKHWVLWKRFMHLQANNRETLDRIVREVHEVTCVMPRREELALRPRSPEMH